MTDDKLKNNDCSSIKFNKPDKYDTYYFSKTTPNLFVVKGVMEIIEVKQTAKNIIVRIKSTDLKLLSLLKDIEFHIIMECYKEYKGWFDKSIEISKFMKSFKSKIENIDGDFQLDLEFKIDNVHKRIKTKVYDSSKSKISYKKLQSGDLVDIAFELDGVKFGKHNSTPRFTVKQILCSKEEIINIEDYNEYCESDTDSCKF